jgi:putative membrane protein
MSGVAPLIADAAAGVHPLATTNALLNALATVLLVAGWRFIRRGDVRRHRAAMVAAFAVSAVFLVCYLTYHALVGHVPFRGQGAVRPVYFTILISHIVLAAAVPVLAIAMFVLAWRGRFETHRRLGRIALPIWLYVSVTGVLIYLMLYHWFA